MNVDDMAEASLRESIRRAADIMAVPLPVLYGQQARRPDRVMHVMLIITAGYGNAELCRALRSMGMPNANVPALMTDGLARFRIDPEFKIRFQRFNGLMQGTNDPTD